MLVLQISARALGKGFSYHLPSQSLIVWYRGKLVVDRSTMSPKLNCKNWECGVLLPVPAMVLGRTLSGTPEQKGPIDIHAFEKTVPVPMETPGEKLEGRQPWFFMEQ
jgi:hypothetical protein